MPGTRRVASGAVAAAAAAVGWAARRRQPPAWAPLAGDAVRAEISGGQGAQAGARNEQVNQYIQAYIELHHRAAGRAQGSVAAGKVLPAVAVQDPLKRTAEDPYRHGAAEAIVLALDAVANGDQTGLCRGLINVVALLSAAGVARPLLYAAGQQGLLQPPGTGTAAGPESIDEALGRLASASLLTFSVDDATVAAHRLTMRVAVERQAQEGSLAGLGAGTAGLLSMVTQALDQPWQNRHAARDTIQQIMGLHERLAPYLGEQDGALTETLLRLRGWAIRCLNDLGDGSAQAIEYGQSLLADCERVLGENHPRTLTSRSSLAAAYQAAGRLHEAIPLLERTLADFERILGENHPNTLTSRNNLANVFQAAGRLDEAQGLRYRTAPGS